MKADLKYKGVDFSDIESDREFYGCTFEECSFARAKLTNVLFSRCEFIRCDFSLCKIYGVSFQDVRVVGGKRVGVGVTLSIAIWKKRILPNVILRRLISTVPY